MSRGVDNRVAPSRPPLPVGAALKSYVPSKFLCGLGNRIQIGANLVAINYRGSALGVGRDLDSSQRVSLILILAASERWIRHFAPKYDKLSPKFLQDRGSSCPPFLARRIPGGVRRAKSRPAFKLSSLINYKSVEGSGLLSYVPI
ncbi:hypothetical protein ACJJTC_012201 [Scirpophaga incertulas]